MRDNPSKRVVDQRVRNNIIDWLEFFCRRADAVDQIGIVEYFECFFDNFAYHDEPGDTLKINTAISPDEAPLIAEVYRVVREASLQTSERMSHEDFVRSGWPDRIAEFSERALIVLNERGRLSNEAEEY
jgi:hypothetical protein